MERAFCWPFIVIPDENSRISLPRFIKTPRQVAKKLSKTGHASQEKVDANRREATAKKEAIEH
jgi:hypothetical protein